MKNILFVAFIFIIHLLSCGPPPEGAETVNGLTIVNDMLDEMYKIQDKPEIRKKNNKEFEDLNWIFAFSKNGTLEVYLKELKENHPLFDPKRMILKTTEDNSLEVVRPLYVTYDFWKQMYISFNKEWWYPMRNDLENNIENYRMVFDMNKTLDIENASLSVGFAGGVTLVETSKPVKLENKKIVTLEKGMIFDAKDAQKITTDLVPNILHLPQGTRLTMDYIIEGNLLEVKTKGSNYSIKFLRDIFLFPKGQFISISFDNEDWDNPIFSFTFNMYNSSIATSDKRIFFLNKLEITRNGL